MKNVAFSRCCFVTFYKQRQRNEHIIVTHAYPAIIVLVAVAVKICLIKLPKIEQTAKNSVNSQMNTKQTKARQNKKTAKSTESICAINLFQVISGCQLPLFFKLIIV